MQKLNNLEGCVIPTAVGGKGADKEINLGLVFHCQFLTVEFMMRQQGEWKLDVRDRRTDREREQNRRRGGRERQKSPETREGEEERDAARTRHESLGALVAGRSAELTDSLISFPADNETNSSRFEQRLAGEQTLP